MAFDALRMRNTIQLLGILSTSYNLLCTYCAILGSQLNVLPSISYSAHDLRRPANTPNQDRSSDGAALFWSRQLRGRLRVDVSGGFASLTSIA